MWLDRIAPYYLQGNSINGISSIPYLNRHMFLWFREFPFDINLKDPIFQRCIEDAIVFSKLKTLFEVSRMYASLQVISFFLFSFFARMALNHERFIL